LRVKALKGTFRSAILASNSIASNETAENRQIAEEAKMESGNEMMKLENQVCFALYSFAREITKLYHPLLKEIGLTYTQYITMLVLWEKDGISLKELGSRLYLDSGTLTPLLKKLERLGMITRYRDPSDERIVRIELTGPGIALKEKAQDIPIQLFCRSGVSADEADGLRQQVSEAMRKLQENLSAPEDGTRTIQGGK
jgi:DNA-binding MarR family transcriptional regulator